MIDKATEILKNIEDKKIKPKSKWVFLAKDYLVWGLFVLATLVGAMAISVIIFIINDNDWDIYKYLQKSIWAYFLILMPYFWIIILGILSFLAYFNYTHTRKGYLLNPYLVIFGSILFSIILGWALFAVGASQKIDKIFAQKIPYYKNTEMHKNVFWNNPDKGLLAGEIIEIKNDHSFLLKDLESNKWQIVGENIIWKEKVAAVAGEKIKIIGQVGGKNLFEAREVRPWGCGCNLCESDESSSSDSCGMSQGKTEGKGHTCKMN
ncbi:MAG: hypothetical protein WAV16_03695 [Candidatus Moraniibacteriota bacterium]